jgi:hypothetical protein
MIPFPAPFYNILVSTSPTKLNKRGEMGSPYLRPLPGLKRLLSSPFKLTPTDPPYNQMFNPLNPSTTKTSRLKDFKKEVPTNPIVGFFII